MQRPRLLFILNEGRYVSQAFQLDRLKEEGVIEEWIGISLIPMDRMAKLIRPKDLPKITYFRDFPKHYTTYAEANEYLEAQSCEIPMAHFGKVFSAEKYPHR